MEDMGQSASFRGEIGILVKVLAISHQVAATHREKFLFLTMKLEVSWPLSFLLAGCLVS
jgi:hypothetical protein